MKYVAVFIVLTAIALAVPPTSSPDAPPNVEAADAARRATVPSGTTVSLWAAEPLMANPVAFCFDEQGRAYVAETTRFGNGVPDTRSFMHWLDDDIGARTVDDRLAMYKRHKYGNFEKYDDQVRRVWDSTGKGVADKSTVFANGFNKPEDGIGAGVLARKGDVYFTNIPNLYKLRDTNADGVAEQRDVLSTGYGVRAQFLGHDLHGLRMGPDGRLYFSIGDRGFNVVNKEGKRLYNPDSGAVLRCEPDGSNLEIVHIGLRNPQELAFDDYGNLFTYDNNCDSGDRARWVQIVPGGDSGWRCGYQYGTLYHTPAVKEGNRGPWNTEKIWHLQNESQPANILPPLAHFGNGPAGITHYPGLGLNDKYKDHFFACDFTSNAGSSVIWSLAVKPKGASFEVVDREPFVKNMVPTDCEFGPDCNFYWSDWVSGWNPQDKGRIFKLTDAEAQQNPKVKEARELIASGMSKIGIQELLKLLEHPHQQVRLEAQYELLTRPNADVYASLVDLLKDSKNQIARLHAIWALGQYHRRVRQDPVELIEILKDTDPILRAAAARTLGESARTFGIHSDSLLPLLKDPEPSVQFHAALALHQFLELMTLPRDVHLPIMPFVTAAGKDPYLRHAAVVLLSSYLKATGGQIANGQDNLTANEKIVLVLALRRIGDANAEDRLVKLLADADPQVSIEAARAIYDERMMTAMPALAALSDAVADDAILFRALAANFLLGEPSNAAALAKFAANRSRPDYLRVTALKLLADWAKPPRRDPITGLRLELKARDATVAKDALMPVLDDIFIGSDAVHKDAVACVTKLGIKEVGPAMARIINDVKQPVETRVAALLALDALKAKEFAAAVPIAESSTEPWLRGAVRTAIVRRNPKQIEQFATLLDDAGTSIIEKQMMLAALGTLPESATADTLLATWLDRLKDGAVPDELKLEVFEAAQARSTAKKLKLHADLKAKLADYDKLVRKNAGSKRDKRYPEILKGGDVARGREIFLNNAAVSCQRCHKLDGTGGDVGPPVNGIGREKSREYLLESILVPNAQIAEGFASVILETADGKKVSGVLRKQTKEKYTLLTPENTVLEIAAADVESEKPDKSAMPDDVHQKLSRREMRDLVEFLASLKEKK